MGSASNLLSLSEDMTWSFVFHFEKLPVFILFCFLGFFKHSNVKNVGKTIHLLCLALNVVIKYKLLDEIRLKCIKHANLVWYRQICLMKSLLENKLHQTVSSNTIFFFFSKFFEIMVHLKYIKYFIKRASLMMFDEVFDAFAPALIAVNFEWPLLTEPEY